MTPKSWHRINLKCNARSSLLYPQERYLKKLP